MKKFYLVFSLFIPVLLSAQTYSGTVRNAASGEQIPFVNIGIVNKGVGTISLADGSFQLPLAGEYDNDTLRFSIIGYTPVSYCVKDYKRKFKDVAAIIQMTESVTELQTVIVKPLSLISVIKGNTFDSKSFIAGWKSNDLGSELGTIINVKDGITYYLKNVQVNIASCKYDSILFRMNIYNYRNGTPDSLLQSVPIYLRVYKDQRYLYVDLAPYNIAVDGDFFIALEWLDDLPDKTTSFMFCAGLFGASTHFRKTSQDAWQKVPVGVGFSVELEYEKK